MSQFNKERKDIETIDIPLEDLLGMATEGHGSLPSVIDYVDFSEFKDRMLIINGDIGDYLMTLIRQIMFYNADDKRKGIAKENRKPIKVCIYSYGGDVNMGKAVMAAIEASETPVWTINMGTAYSMGCMILLAGHRRFAMKHSEALIHEGSASLSGSAAQVADAHKAYQRKLEWCKNYTLEHTTISPALYKKKLKDDWYISDKEQVEYGIVEKLIDNIEELY